MKYIGFRMPKEALDGLDWVYDLMEGKERYKAFIINANSNEQARRKLFDEMFEDDDLHIVFFSLKSYLESYEDKSIIETYGEKDGMIILDILDDLYNLSEKELEELNPYDKKQNLNKKLNLISKEGIRELIYQEVQYDIGVMKVEKELK